MLSLKGNKGSGCINTLPCENDPRICRNHIHSILIWPPRTRRSKNRHSKSVNLSYWIAFTGRPSGFHPRPLCISRVAHLFPNEPLAGWLASVALYWWWWCDAHFGNLIQQQHCLRRGQFTRGILLSSIVEVPRSSHTTSQLANNNASLSRYYHVLVLLVPTCWRRRRR